MKKFWSHKRKKLENKNKQEDTGYVTRGRLAKIHKIAHMLWTY
jgi:hypothetical protein